MSGPRQLPAAEPRVETGPVRFGDDWAGIYIRGDLAIYLAFLLSHVLELLPKVDAIQAITARGGIVSLAKLLVSCSENQEILKAFEHLEDG